MVPLVPLDQFVIETVVTPASGEVVTSQEIVNKTNSGSFTLNSEDAKITFVSSDRRLPRRHLYDSFI